MSAPNTLLNCAANFLCVSSGSSFSFVHNSSVFVASDRVLFFSLDVYLI